LGPCTCCSVQAPAAAGAPTPTVDLEKTLNQSFFYHQVLDPGSTAEGSIAIATKYEARCHSS
tara:strand:+ start:932 stop:1117 length:186 start_codon:yes stop_codon:yes gene_type:complete